MYRFKNVAITMIIAVIIVAGCTGPAHHVAAQNAGHGTQTVGADGTPRSPLPSATPVVRPQEYTITTLAVFPFENNSVTEPGYFAPLRKGLAAMLITDLTQSGTTLKIIEREKIQALLEEIALGQSGAVDQATAIRAGKILGAQSIAFGSFMVLGPTVRIDTRIINVETSALIMAASITGSSNEFMQLEQKLAGKIAGALNVAVRPPRPVSRSDISAALYFSRGLEALDDGRRNDAITLFQKCMKLDPSYRTKVNDLLDS